MSKKPKLSCRRNLMITALPSSQERLLQLRLLPQCFRRLAADERGVEAVEGIGMFFLLLMVGLIIWQFMIFGHQMVVTADVARQGARASAAGYGPWCELYMILDALPQIPIARCGSCSGSGGEVEATANLQIPMVVIHRFLLTETKAIFRCEPNDPSTL